MSAYLLPVFHRPARPSPQPHILGACGPRCADSPGDGCCPGSHLAPKEAEGDAVRVIGRDTEGEEGDD